jgi:ribosomal-protein-alanine N-acetyltransferase
LRLRYWQGNIGGVGVNLGELNFREYRKSDLEAICVLDDACFAEAFRFDRRSMQRFAERRGAIAIVAEAIEGEMGGFVIVHLEEQLRAGRRGYVVTLDVADRWRRHGLASALMDKAEERASEAGAAAMELHVFTGNEAAIRFYEARGYVRTGVAEGFYGAVGLDAFLYGKTLEPAAH